jgi:hypothetical protein
MDDDFMAIIDGMRAAAGFSFPVNSAYRCENHPIEAAKAKPGAHSTGLAIDIGVSRGQAFKVIELALSAGIKRIGVNQKGEGRFIHLDICDSKLSPTIWSY